MGLQVKRRGTVAGQLMPLRFDGKGNKFIVKNFTDGDIYVGVDNGMEATVRIPSLFYQVVMIGEELITNKTNIDTIYIQPEATSEKGVEVQMLLKE